MVLTSEKGLFATKKRSSSGLFSPNALSAYAEDTPTKKNIKTNFANTSIEFINFQFP
jgi:hypothetical protein